MSTIDYSKWDKLNFSDSEDDDEQKKAPPSHQAKKPPTEKKAPPSPTLCGTYSRYPPTRVRRTFEYDFENMAEADWEELHKSTEHLHYLNEAYGFGMTGLPQPHEISTDNCRNLYNDMKDHKDFWLQEIFHPEEADKDPPNVDRAVIALCHLSNYYYQRKKYRKAMGVVELLSEVMECFRIMMFENKTFTISKEQKERFYQHEYRFHLQRYNSASMLGYRDLTVESFRKCAEHELIGIGSMGKTFVEMIAFHCQLDQLMQGNIAAMTPPTITVSKLRNEVTDDEIWSMVSMAAGMAKRASHETMDYTQVCPVCTSQENLKLCSCGTAAYCSAQHQQQHWIKHKKQCKCPVCGSSEKLSLCNGCHQIAFCSREHLRAYWSTHKKSCKDAKNNGTHIGKPVVATDEGMGGAAKLFTEEFLKKAAWK